MVQIKFKSPSAAAECIQLMDGRFFGGHKSSCFYWDGKTDYRKPPETEEEEKKRIADFGVWLGDEKAINNQEKSDSEDEPEEKQEERGVSSEVVNEIQKMLDEKLAQLRKEKMEEMAQQNINQ